MAPSAASRRDPPPLLPGAENDEELRRQANRSIVRLSGPGIVVYPLACLVLGRVTELPQTDPLAYYALLAAVAFLSVVRGYLTLAFGKLYGRSPDRWRRLYGASLIGTVLIWVTLACWASTIYEVSYVTFFAILMSAVLSNLALITYTPSLLLVRLVPICLIVPHFAAYLYFSARNAGFIIPVTVMYLLYLWGAGGRLYRKYWEAMANTRLLELRAVELERAEAELLRHREHLEELVRERTRSLEVAVASLESKNAELAVKNAEMERFTYTISHDLKSPLLTIRGFLGLLEQDVAAGDADRMKTDIERIYGAAGQMARLLDDLLELSRIGRVINAPRVVSLAELTSDAAALLAGAIAERGAEVEISPELPEVTADGKRLREVLQNLIENAVKFMGGQPAPRIEIGVRQEEEVPVFYVRDNGIGVDPRYHDKIFGLFERLDHLGTDGTGVGLALVKRIIEFHGGKIWIESEGAGRGSCFCFTLGTLDNPDPDALANE